MSPPPLHRKQLSTLSAIALAPRLYPLKSAATPRGMAPRGRPWSSALWSSSGEEARASCLGPDFTHVRPMLPPCLRPLKSSSPETPWFGLAESIISGLMEVEVIRAGTVGMWGEKIRQSSTNLYIFSSSPCFQNPHLLLSPFWKANRLSCSLVLLTYKHFCLTYLLSCTKSLNIPLKKTFLLW